MCLTGAEQSVPLCDPVAIYLPLLFSDTAVKHTEPILHTCVCDAVIAVTTVEKLDRYRTYLQGTTLRWATISTCMDQLSTFARNSGVHIPPYVEQLVAEQAPRLLTHREMQILKLIATGNSIKEISHTLGISVHTVTTHKRNLYLKTGAHTMQQLALFAVLHLYGTV